MPPQSGFFRTFTGNIALSALPLQSRHFHFHIKYVNLLLKQCRGPPQLFICVLLIRCFFFYLHFQLLVMFQGQEESHEENQILKRQIGKVIIFKSSSFFFFFLIVIHLLDVMMCSFTCLVSIKQSFTRS